MKFKEVKLKNKKKKLFLLPTLIKGSVSPWLTNVPSLTNLLTFALIQALWITKIEIQLRQLKSRKDGEF